MFNMFCAGLLTASVVDALEKKRWGWALGMSAVVALNFWVTLH